MRSPYPQRRQDSPSSRIERTLAVAIGQIETDLVGQTGTEGRKNARKGTEGERTTRQASHESQSVSPRRIEVDDIVARNLLMQKNDSTGRSLHRRGFASDVLLYLITPYLRRVLLSCIFRPHFFRRLPSHCRACPWPSRCVTERVWESQVASFGD